MISRGLCALLFFVLSFPAVVHAQLSLRSFTIDSGGGLVSSSDGSLVLRSSIGQPDAARLSNGAVLLDGGFWPTIPQPLPPCGADFNGDQVLNSDDLSDFITGYFNLPPDPATDFNADGVINADDLGDYVTAYFNGC